MPQSSTSQVFMSYSRRDNDVMRRVVSFLRKEGIKVWVDNEKLIPGTPIWEEEIEKAIRNAPAIIVVLSPDSKNSEWVRREISLADQYRKRVFPVLVRGDEETSITLRLINRQFVDIRKDEETGLNSVTASLSLYLQELDALEQKAKKEATQKTRTEKRQAKQKAEEERKKILNSEFKIQNLEADRLAAQEIEEERIAREKVDTDNRLRKAKEDADRFAAQKIEEERIAREKEDLPPATAEIYQRSYRTSYKATQAFLPKLKIPALILVIGFIGYLLWQGFASIPLRPDPSPTPIIPATFTIIPPTKTKTPMPTETVIPTSTTPNAGEIMTGTHGEKLVYVPEGEFTMGSDTNSDEQPIHTVYLDAFWIDQNEVTNKQYQACVDAGTCERPSSLSSYTHPSYYGNPEFDDYPVLYVNWDKANRYCEVWAGGDLPTEAQWEKAARGTDKRTYPWGNDVPNKDLLNYNSNIGDTTEVGSYENGKSFYGAYDMAGNVWEWVNDWYSETYYQSSSASNPLGPDTGQYRVLRGGSWYNNDYGARSSFRVRNTPDNADLNFGFRCARSLP